MEKTEREKRREEEINQVKRLVLASICILLITVSMAFAQQPPNEPSQPPPNPPEKVHQVALQSPINVSLANQSLAVAPNPFIANKKLKRSAVARHSKAISVAKSSSTAREMVVQSSVPAPIPPRPGQPIGTEKSPPAKATQRAQSSVPAPIPPRPGSPIGGQRPAPVKRA